VRIVVTGGAGFIGRAVVERLVTRGDRVVALVRDQATAAHLGNDNAELVTSDLAAAEPMAATMRGADAVVHIAGMYRIGIRRSERPAMWDANVGATERVLDAAIAAGVPRIVYVSTYNVAGDTHGKVVDETYRRPPGEGFLSWYDETKLRAHEAAEARIAAGAPVIIAMPSQVYGPFDHSTASEQLALARGGRLSYLAFADLGLAWVHVHDLAAGLVATLDRGRIGEAYGLAGECRRLGESVAIAARVGGHRAPRLHVPTPLLRAMAPLNDRLGGLPGLPHNLAETISSGAGVTYWGSHDKASRELGFAPRTLAQGIADTWGGTAGPAA
jgi:nucleoside-diphosphate-sugar epimerase